MTPRATSKLLAMELTVRIHREDASYWAEVVELPGCFASGETVDELVEALRESVNLCLDSPPGRGARAPFELAEMKLAVPSPQPATRP
jgi:predicted RNase H-like HicB family nuclease